MGLFDMFGGGANGPGGLYGDALTPEQKQALSYNGLLGFLGGMQKSGALDYTVPFISGKVPGGLAAGLAGGMAGMGEVQDKAALNALNAQLVSLKGKDLQSTMAARQKLMEVLPGLAGGGGPATAPPATAISPTPATAGGPDTVVPSGDNWEITHNNFGGLRIPGSTTGPKAGGFQAFATPEDGLGAISRQLDRYASGATTGKPLTSLRQIVSTWAPPSENPTSTLIDRAAQVTGFDPDAQLNVSDPAVKAKLIEATIRNEQGGKLPVDPALIQRVAFNQGAPALTVGGGLPAVARGPTLAPGFSRDATGGLTRNGQPPDAMIGGNPAWQEGTGPFPAGLMPPPPMPRGGAQLASMSGTPGAADMSAIPRAAPGATLSVPGMPNSASAMPAGGPAAMPAPAGAAVSPPLINGIDPRALAAAGTFAQIGGLGDAVKPLETYYYNSPGYKQEVAKREALGKLFGTLIERRAGGQTTMPVIDPITGEVTGERQIGYTPTLPAGANLQPGPNGPIATPVPGAADLIRTDAKAKAGGTAAYEPQPVLLPGGGLGVLPRSTVLEAGAPVPTALSPGEKTAQEAKATATETRQTQAQQPHQVGQYVYYPPGTPQAADIADKLTRKEQLPENIRPDGKGGVFITTPADQTGEKRNANLVVQDIDRALVLSQKGGWPSNTGSVAALTKSMPGTEAYNLASLLDTIKSNVSFQTLNEMRKASPTGGALGQVSNMEEQMLSRSRGNLEQAQNKEQFEFNLRRLKNQFLDVVDGSKDQLDQFVREGKLSPAQRDSALAKRESLSGPAQSGEPTAPRRFKWNPETQSVEPH